MITSLEIKNFKGLENVKYENFGLINSIYGKNDSGKSSILDCIFWLLCDSTILYGSTSNNDELINVNKPNELISASLIINGNKIERCYGHKLNDDETITDVNYYYINDRRCKSQKEYFEFVDNFLGLKFKTKEKINLKYALMNPFVLGKEIKQEVFRRLIKEILDVDFDKIVFEKSKNKYDDIKKDYEYQGCDINNLKTYYKQQISKMSSLINNLNIDNDITSSLDDLKNKYNDLLAKKTTLSINNRYVESEKLQKIQNNIQELNKKLYELKQKDLENSKPKINVELINQIKELKESVNLQISQYNQMITINNEYKSFIDINKVYIKSVEEQINVLNETLKNYKSIVCPNCGTEIMTDEQKEIIKNTKFKIQELENKKQEYLSSINKHENKINDLKPQIKDLQTAILLGKDKLQELQKELDDYNNKQIQFVESEETIKANQELNDLKNKYNELKKQEIDNFNDSQINVQNQLNNLDQELNMLNNEMNIVIKNDNLKLQKRNYLSQKAKFEVLLTLAKDYANDLANVINQNCYKIFGDDIEFVMVKKNKSNDEQKPVCYAQIKSIPYNSLNSANNLLAGIIVVEKIKQFINSKDIPILFDVVDNIGENTLQKIQSKTSSQIFFTEVDRTDKNNRELKIIK